ncbi:hypothetical protein GE061_016447 [Apolygus lucorum]|uniref:Uncharacterized protein n=1 Tax=Apolygus lucorum TaxID=248454 RepID=A0A6A4K9R4_APOLU|nr:hypothetical protein GE061_016447 [Apolygus lucorum]
MSFKWRGRTSLFLKVYKRYECLWDKKCPKYSKTRARDKAYASMIADLNIPGLTVLDIKSKIKSVRTRYASELTKVRNSELSGAKLYEPRLFWFKDADSFLRQVTFTKLGYSYEKFQDLASTNSFHDGAADLGQEFEKVEQPTTDNEEDEEALPQNAGISPVVTMTTSPAISTSFQNGRRTRKRYLNDSVPEKYDSMKKSKVSKSKPPHEFDVFCESLAIQLKKMPLKRALLCQEKLQRVMTEERLFQLSSNSSTYQQGRDYSEKQRSMMPSPSLSIQSQSSHSSEEDEQEVNIEGIANFQVKIEK